MRNCFLILNPQNDYCHPNGSLFSRTEKDFIDELSVLIQNNLKDIDGIVVSLDTHNVMDINHPCYWVDINNKKPEPFTQISKKEVKGRRYTVFMPNVPESIVLEKQKMVVEYLTDLESIGKKHEILPYRCVQGTWGCNIEQKLNDSLFSWSIQKGRDYILHRKGMYPHVQFFGSFEAEVPDPKAPETTIVSSQNIMSYMDTFERVFLCGTISQVNHTLSQIIKIVRDTNFVDLIDRYVVVYNQDEEQNLVFKQAKQMGFKFVKLEQINLRN